MIVQTTRIRRDGGVRYLAHHLLDKTFENERIEVLAGDRQALDDAHALASVKGCRYSVRHLSVSPERNMSPAQLSEFLRAVDDEFKIGRNRPRLVVRHTKKGRSHFHIAIGEVDPITLRVLDCRNDFARLETLARRYEADHHESIQPSRDERRRGRAEGFSDAARKRAEREATSFDRTKLRKAFSEGYATFHAELVRQGLRVADGDKGPILVTTTGAFVAAACRAVGVRRADFQRFSKKEIRNGQFIGDRPKPLVRRVADRAHCDEPPAAPEAAGNSRPPRPARTTARSAEPRSKHAEATSYGVAHNSRPPRTPVQEVSRWHLHETHLQHQLHNVDLDALLLLARTLVAWMQSIFEPASEIGRASCRERVLRLG